MWRLASFIIRASAGVAASAVLLPNLCLGSPALEKVFPDEDSPNVAAIEFRDGHVYLHLSKDQKAPVYSAIASAISLDRNQRLIVSRDRTQLGRVSYQTLEGKRISTFEFLQNWLPVWNVTVPGFSDFSISDDGSTVVETLRDIHLPTAGRLTIYGKEGEVLGSRSQVGIQKVDLNHDGTRIAVNTQDELVVLDRTAEVRQRFKSALDFGLSPDGRSIALIRPEEVTVVNDTLPSPVIIPTAKIASDVDFSNDGTLLVIIDPENLYVLRTTTGEMISRVRAKPNAYFEDVDFRPDAKRIAVSTLAISTRRTSTGMGRAQAEIVILDLLGTLQEREIVDFQEWKGTTPTVEFVDNTKLFMTLDGEPYVLAIPQ